MPGALVVLAVLGACLFLLPLIGLLSRAPWRTVISELAAPRAAASLRLSLVASLAATALSLLLGVPLAVLQARSSGRAGALLRALTVIPLVMPPVVGGVALLTAFGRAGVAGRWLAEAGVALPFSFAGVVAAETFVAMPFLVLSVEAGLRAADPGLEEAARSLGARPWRLLRRVVLPMARPSLVAGSVLAWARAVGEFGATITFAGSIPGRTQTAPLAVYRELQTRPDAAVALSLALVAACIGVVLLTRDRWGGTR